LKKEKIYPVSHYVPLHGSLAGKRFGKTNEKLVITNNTSKRLVRLPFWIGLENYIEKALRHIKNAL